MASLWTTRGVYLILGAYFRGVADPANFFMGLVTVAVPPTFEINTFGELTEIAAGNGYATGGISIARNSTDFDVYTEDDTNDRALIQIKDTVWTASGGPIPASGAGASYAVLLDDNVTVGSRQVISSGDLVSPRTVSDGQTLTIQDYEHRLSNV